MLQVGVLGPNELAKVCTGCSQVAVAGVAEAHVRGEGRAGGQRDGEGRLLLCQADSKCTPAGYVLCTELLMNYSIVHHFTILHTHRHTHTHTHTHR